MATGILIGMFGGFILFLCVFKFLEHLKAKYSQEDEKIFLSDIYKLQIKWIKRGCYSYGELLRLVIVSLSAPPQEKPKTSYGQSTKKALEEE